MAVKFIFGKWMILLLYQLLSLTLNVWEQLVSTAQDQGIKWGDIRMMNKSNFHLITWHGDYPWNSVKKWCSMCILQLWKISLEAVGGGHNKCDCLIMQVACLLSWQLANENRKNWDIHSYDSKIHENVGDRHHNIGGKLWL